MVPIQPTDALLVVDVQNDFCPGGALGIAGGDEIVPVVNALAQRFVHVLLTQDWHPPAHISFASAHPGAQPYGAIDTPYGAQALWPDHCVQSTLPAPAYRNARVRPTIPSPESSSPFAVSQAESVTRSQPRRFSPKTSQAFRNPSLSGEGSPVSVSTTAESMGLAESRNPCVAR